jgi:methylamine dehydrogenase accessory protein MauD
MEALIVSNVILWIVVIALAIVVLALMRQIGVLHERVFPAGALMTAAGPKVGEPVPVTTLKTIAGGDVQIGGADAAARSTLLLFVSPTCPVCKTLLPIVRSVLRSEGATHIVLASDADSDAERVGHERFVRENDLPADRYVLSRALGLSFLVDKLPFAALIDARGVLRAKGLVNSREHLESLFEAQARGVASLQEYLGAKLGASAR